MLNIVNDLKGISESESSETGDKPSLGSPLQLEGSKDRIETVKDEPKVMQLSTEKMVEDPGTTANFIHKCHFTKIQDLRPRPKMKSASFEHVKRFSGDWKVNLNLSDKLDDLHRFLGIPWIYTSAMRSYTTVLTFKATFSKSKPIGPSGYPVQLTSKLKLPLSIGSITTEYPCCRDGKVELVTAPVPGIPGKCLKVSIWEGNSLWTVYTRVDVELPWDQIQRHRSIGQVNSTNTDVPCQIIECRTITPQDTMVQISMATKARLRRGMRVCTWSRLVSSATMSVKPILAKSCEFICSTSCKRVFNRIN